MATNLFDDEDKKSSSKTKKTVSVKLTKDQKEAVKSIQKFIKEGSPNGWFVLSGKAGTGKTTTISEVINSLSENKKVICGAISHKAKKVLESKIKNDKISISFHTIASMLNMQLNLETGKFEPTYSDSIVPPISKADIIFIDECSMIDEDAMSLIMTMKKSKAKVIYLGDINQLPPIRENENGALSHEQIESVSPTFSSDDIFYLSERLRQGEESPILPFSDVFSEALKGGNMDFKRENILGDKGSIYFTTLQNAVSTSMNLFKRSVDEKDMELIKVICYRNETRRNVNQYIRSCIFGDDASKTEFIKGDILIMMDNYPLDDDGNVLENSSEFQVISCDEKTAMIDDVHISYYALCVSYKVMGRYVEIPVVKNTSKDALSYLISKRFEKAKKMAKGVDRNIAFQKAYALSHRFANLDYAYAITSHKSQGSTYKVAIVCERDIMGCYATSWKTKIRSMYTAVTRASKMCIIAN